MKLPFLLGCLLYTLWSFPQDDPRLVAYHQIINYQEPEDLFEGVTQYESFLLNDLQNGDTLKALYDTELLSLGYYYLGDYFRAESYSVDGLQLADAYSDSSKVIGTRYRTNNQLGLLYDQLLDYNKSLAAYEEALKESASRADSASILNNIGLAYYGLENYDNALANFLKALELVQSSDQKEKLGRYHTNIGKVQSALGQAGAIDNLLKGLALRKEIKDSDGRYASYRALARHYEKLQSMELALKYADSALAVAEQVNSPSFRKDAYSLLIDLGRVGYVGAFKKLSDSLDRVKQLRDNKYAALKYDVDKEKERTQALELQQEREKRLRWLLSALAFLVLLALVFYLYYLRTQQRQREQQQVLETENRISKRVHDEVANEVYGVMTRLQGKEQTEPALLDHLERLYHKTRNISREYNPIDHEEDYGQLLSDLILTYRSESVNILTRNLSKIDWNRLNRTKKTILYRVIQELLTNMKKHSGASVVALTFTQEGKKLQVDYADNGRGSELKHKGGLRITETRIQSIGGTIIFETEPEKGFKAKMVL